MPPGGDASGDPTWGSMDSDPQFTAVRDRMSRVLLTLLLAALAWTFLASAWLSDDAWITLRSIDQFLAGNGLRFNAAERVQAFTHPLWALLLAGAIGTTGEFYFTTLVFSGLCTAGAVALLVVGIARGPAPATLGLAVLLGSKAFVDYSSSGLENPLLHLLLAGFLVLWLARDGQRLLPMTLLASAVATTRPDAVLLVAPALAAAAVRSGRMALRPLALGLLPLAAWSIFSLVYYGFPFPNTAYAKLGSGAPLDRLALQGFAYLADSAIRDPVSLLAVLGSCAVSLAFRVRGAGAVTAGILLSLAYVVWIGGDFMAGRFLAAPLFCAAALLTRIPTRKPNTLAWFAVAVVSISFLGDRPTLASGRGYGVGWPDETETHGIVDERAGYYPFTGLWRVLAGDTHPSRHPWARQGTTDGAQPTPVKVVGPAGLYGFYLGRNKHLVDEFGLVDPLLARLPMEPDATWRIGHFPRRIPEGYYETLVSGRNRIRDPELAALWADLALITRGPLFSQARWAAIARRNLDLPPPPVAGPRR